MASVFAKYTKVSTGIVIILGFIFIPISIVLSQSIDYKTSQEINEINDKIKSKSDLIDELQSKAEQFAELIYEKQTESNSLENELSIIKNRIAKLEIDVERKNTEIDKTNLRIRETDLQIMEKEHQIEFQKIQLAGLLREINRQDKRSRLEILFANDSLSKFFAYIKSLEDVQSNMQVALAGVKDTKRELEIHEHTLETEKANLQKLLMEIEIEKQKYEQEKSAKEYLIEETQMSELEFQKQLSLIRYQQRVADEEIRSLEKAVKEKLRLAQLSNPNIEINPGQLLWPIPNQGITAYFHDPTYPYKHIVGAHSGIDIRTLINGTPSMGLPIRAPAAGIVIKTIVNGRYTGNAIYLSHGDLLTVYFHLSELYVSTDDFVEIGEIMGLSGGSPGHPGSGLSSGPHLHFEVRQNGIPVDPCAYLTPSCY